MSKFCAKCGNEIQDNVNICDKCGSEVNSSQQTTIINQTVVSKEKSNGCAIAGMVIGIIDIIFGGGLWLIGLILSIVGLSKSSKMNGSGKGQAIAGLIINIIGLLEFLIIFISILLPFFLIIIGAAGSAAAY